MGLEQVRCPSCGAPLQLEDGASQVTCAWCGSTFRVSFPGQNTSRSAGIEPDGTIRDQGTGRGLFVVPRVAGFSVVGTSLEQTGSSSYPYLGHVALQNGKGASITLSNGIAGSQQSAGNKAMTAMYGGAIAGVAQVNYADVPDPVTLADSAATEQLRRLGVAQARLVGQVQAGDLEAYRQEALAFFHKSAQAQGVPAQPVEAFAASVPRVYEFTVGNDTWRMCSYVRLEAVKWSMGGMGNLMGQMGGLASRLGQMFGAGPASLPQQQRSGATPQNDFEAFRRQGNIEWTVNLVATYTAPADQFNEGLSKAFLPLATQCATHNDVVSLTLMAAQQTAAGIQQATNLALAQSQAAFNAQQAAHRQQQAAFDAYNDSISAARDARHASFRAATNAQFAGDSSGSGGVDFSEAIRGVNTFVTSDGREVELSVHSDVAYENQAGDVVGGSSGFDPGADWTQIPRK